VGPRAGLDRCRKSQPPPGFDPPSAQPIASRYTDRATRSTLYWILHTLLLDLAFLLQLINLSMIQEVIKALSVF
jgi:hypothetical protein